MVSTLRKRTCILVSMSIPCHICKGKRVSGVGGIPTTPWHPHPGDTNGGATNLKEVFEGDALIDLVWSLWAAREKRLRLPYRANGALGDQGMGQVSHRCTVLAPHHALWPAPNWFPEAPWLRGAAF